MMRPLPSQHRPPRHPPSSTRRQRKRMNGLVQFTASFLVILLVVAFFLAYVLSSMSGAGSGTTGTTGGADGKIENAAGGGGHHRYQLPSSPKRDRQQEQGNDGEKRKVADRLFRPAITTPEMFRGIGRFSFRGKSRDRIAIVLPFVGESKENVPSYLNLFCVGAAGAADVVDFLVVHNGVLDHPPLGEGDAGSQGGDNNGNNNNSGLDCPANVKFISLGSTEIFVEHLLRVVDHKLDGEEDLAVSRRKLVALVSKHIEACPYCLVEFKPALGHIFADYLVGYSHWGYSDLDMLYGDLGRWIDPSELKDYDIVTYGFGDQHRLYVRGQFTFHKNNEKVNKIWKSCTYLSDLDTRLVSVVRGDSKYKFESAEGCYSLAVLQQTDIRVKYAVKAWTDIHEEDTAYTHGIYISRSHKKENKVVVYKAESADFGSELTKAATAAKRPAWFEKDVVYRDRKQPLQEHTGEMEEISLPNGNDPDAKCMYWVQSKYQPQLCLPKNAVSGTDTIFWIDGKLYKQAHRSTQLQTRGVTTAPFFHLQEWKRYFRPSQLAPLHHSSPSSLFVLVKEGAIPLPGASSSSRYSHRAVIPSPLQVLPKRWKEATQVFRTLLPSRPYCLISGPRKFPPQPPAPACYQQVSWRDDETVVRILSGAPGWTKVRMDLDVTLVLTLQLTGAQAGDDESLSEILDIAAENLSRWKGQPCVLLIHVSGPTEEAMSHIQQRFVGLKAADLQSVGGVDNALIAVVSGDEGKTVSRKALLNMAIDAVPTRWYISGMELERGLVLSNDAAYFAHRALLTYESNSWDVFLIPQFALDDDDDENGLDVALSDLEAAKDGDGIHAPSDVEANCDEDVVVRLDKTEDLWWILVKSMLDSEKIDLSNTAESIRALELSALEYLTDEHHLKMFALDESPIMMIDNIGPHAVRTDEVAREVEELGGRRCYNGLKLAQLAALGYRFSTLTTFAVSTETTREAVKQGVDETVPGWSRCDGCFMFGDEHEDILEDIIGDEIRRPGKAAVLWGELNDETIKSEL